jgi:hypothetical protein
MKEGMFTTTGNAYWHYHPFGIGVIFTYHTKAMQIMMTCESTGQLIEVQDFYDIGGLTQVDFKDICMEFYKTAIEMGKTTNLDYMDDPTIVGCIGVDFDLIKN